MRMGQQQQEHCSNGGWLASWLAWGDKRHRRWGASFWRACGKKGQPSPALVYFLVFLSVSTPQSFDFPWIVYINCGLVSSKKRDSDGDG